ncbi:hypothetical protein AB0N71_09225 [Pseudarthrobacter enclensis]|uniref:hypothetical protein n=1 Tax=Pseudarthrobacter enclensis TaxID=993070 RepID=UPI003437F171
MQVGDAPEEAPDKDNATRHINRELARRRGWMLTVAVGFALHLLSVVVGLKPVAPSCGSPLIPHSGAAELSDAQLVTTGLAAECYRTIDSAAVPVWLLMGAGIALVLAGVVVRIVGIRRSLAALGA